MAKTLIENIKALLRKKKFKYNEKKVVEYIFMFRQNKELDFVRSYTIMLCYPILLGSLKYFMKHKYNIKHSLAEADDLAVEGINCIDKCINNYGVISSKGKLMFLKANQLGTFRVYLWKALIRRYSQCVKLHDVQLSINTHDYGEEKEHRKITRNRVQISKDANNESSQDEEGEEFSHLDTKLSLYTNPNFDINIDNFEKRFVKTLTPFEKYIFEQSIKNKISNQILIERDKNLTQRKIFSAINIIKEKFLKEFNK